MTEWLVSNEEECVWKEAVMEKFALLFQNVPKITEEKHWNFTVRVALWRIYAP